VVGLLFWFSLAAHLRLGLGRWPESIGLEPGTSFFRAHTSITWWLIIIGFYATVAAGVVGGILLLIRRVRRWSVYPLVFAAACLIAFGMAQLVPRSFITWFLD